MSHMDEEFGKNGLGIAAMVCGIVSVSLSAVAIPIGIFFFFWGCVISLFALGCGIFSIVAGAKAKQYPPIGQAIAGLVLGIIGTSLHVVIFLCFLILSILL